MWRVVLVGCRAGCLATRRRRRAGCPAAGQPAGPALRPCKTRRCGRGKEGPCCRQRGGGQASGMAPPDAHDRTAGSAGNRQEPAAQQLNSCHLVSASLLPTRRRPRWVGSPGPGHCSASACSPCGEERACSGEGGRLAALKGEGGRALAAEEPARLPLPLVPPPMPLLPLPSPPPLAMILGGSTSRPSLLQSGR